MFDSVQLFFLSERLSRFPPPPFFSFATTSTNKKEPKRKKAQAIREGADAARATLSLPKRKSPR
jgi:hypothetical protein